MISAYPSLDALPPSYDTLWKDPSRAVFATRAWTEAYAASCIEPGEKLRLYAVGREPTGGDARPLGLVVGLTSRVYSAHVKARVLRFYQPDAVPYLPILANGVEPGDVMLPLIEHVCGQDPAFDVLRMSPVERPSRYFDDVTSALRRAGHIVQPYHMFTNRFERTDGLTSDEYMRQRPSRLRNTVQRRSRKLDRTARGRFELVTGPDDLERAIKDYQSVFAASWKRAELLVPVEYIHEIMRRAAGAGALRLGLLHVDDRPAAAQFWLVTDGMAICYRLAFDERFRSLSVGTILTWQLIRHFLDVDRVRLLDFGVGDDPYKRDWMTESRERWGLVTFNPRTTRGLKGAAIHVGLRPVKRSLKWLVRQARAFRQLLGPGQ